VVFLIKRFLLKLISAYRKHISPGLGSNCRFVPSCSEYAYEAIERFGTVKGSLLMIGRILRCNPFNKHCGYDPVPEKGTGFRFGIRRGYGRNI